MSISCIKILQTNYLFAPSRALYVKMGHQGPTATFTQTDATVSQQSLYIAATTSIQLSTTEHKAHSYRNSRKKTNKGNIYHMTGEPMSLDLCPCYVTIHLKSNFVIFILYHVIMIIIVAWIFAGLLKGLNVGDSQWRRTRPSQRPTFVAPDHTAMRGSRRSKWQLGQMEPTV